MTSLPAISLRTVRKSFPGPNGTAVDAVRGIDLTVQQGEVVAFLGPNGAGKTTTIDMILGLSRPTSGQVQIFGMGARDAVAHGLSAAVMQTGGLLPDLSVRDTVALTASLFVHTTGVDEALERAGIADLAGRPVKKCSGGQQQRLRFAMALVSDPALLILDEPTTGMDVEGRRSFWEAIHADANRGRTVLFATHYLEEADQVADRVVLLSEGSIVADGTTAQIRAMASGRTVRATLTPGADLDRLREELLRAGAHDTDVLGGILTVRAHDTDAIARYLLQAGAGVDLEITSRGLEDAFVTLTAQSATR